jgi:lambda family phage portal protein
MVQAINAGPTKEGVGWAARARAPAPAPVKASVEGFGWGGEAFPVVTDYEAPYAAQSIFRQDVASWRPPMRSGEFANIVRRDLTLARLQDIIRNDAHAGSAIDKLCDHVVGRGLRFQSMPDGAMLGIPDRKARRALAQQIEAEWRSFAEEPRKYADAQQRLSLNGIFRLFARMWFIYGEASGVLSMNEDGAARYQTCVLAIDPSRICNPYGERDTLTRRMGIEQTPLGKPLGYHVRNAHLGDFWAPFEQTSWTFVPRQTSWGRPVFMHGFEPEWGGDGRGTSPLLSIVNRLRMLGKFADNELASATINALFAATVESDEPAEDVAERLRPAATVRENPGVLGLLDHYERFPLRLSNGARIPVMFPNSTLKFNASPRQTTAFPAFETAFLQTISSRLGLAYEQLKGDWSKTNYSSARAALNEVWRGITRARTAFIEQVVIPIQLAWADEAFDRGYLKAPAGAPDFWDCPAAYLKGTWIGPARGYVDPTKEVEASALRIDGRFSTWAAECAEQGLIFEEVFEQQANEIDMLNELGLPATPLTSAMLRSETADETEREADVGAPAKKAAPVKPQVAK